MTLGCVGLKASNAETISLCVNKIEYGNFNRKIGYYNKNTGIAQKIKLNSASTSLTNPCNSCVF